MPTQSIARPRGSEILQRYRELAEQCPEQTAILYASEPCAGTTRTYAELLGRSEQLAREIEHAGVHEGTRCAVVLRDHPDIVPALLALWTLDASGVLLDPSWGARRRASILEHARADYVWCFDDKPELTRLDSVYQDRPPLPPQTAMLGYTSGSTGDPKGIAFTHRKLALTLEAAAAATTMIYGHTPRRIGCSMRLSGSGVLNLHYTWAAFAGATLVVLPELTFATAGDYWRRIEEHQIEQTFLVPTLIELLNHLAKPRREGAPVPLCLTGSAPLSLLTQQRFQQRFGIPLLNAYGLSETMCASFFGHVDERGIATQSVGKPWLLRARLRDADGKIVVGEGEGTIELSGPHVFDGYYSNEPATRAAFEGGWLKTGDVARRDFAGNYYIVGRAKEVVMKGGYSVYLNEVEEAALAIDGVLEAAAVPVELPRGGEDIGLLVRFGPGLVGSCDEIQRLLSEDLGAKRAPFRVQVVAERLPRTGQDKLDRRALSALWASLVCAHGRTQGFHPLEQRENGE